MNIEIELLKKNRSVLEEKYNFIEEEINELYMKGKQNEALKKENIQKLIDLQLIYIDKIVKDMMEIPRIYSDYMNTKRKYDEIVGEYNE